MEKTPFYHSLVESLIKSPVIYARCVYRSKGGSIRKYIVFAVIDGKAHDLSTVFYQWGFKTGGNDGFVYVSGCGFSGYDQIQEWINAKIKNVGRIAVEKI